MGRKVTLTSGVRSQMSDVAGQHIRRTWGDVDVVDAKKDLRLFISPEDVDRATKKDPAYCVFAQACRRTFHATKVLFFRSVAYVELPDDKGTRRVERFVMGDSMRDLVESFDRGEGIIPEGGFLLRRPMPCERLDSETKARSNRKANARRKLEGQREPGPGIGQGRGKYRDQPLLVDLEVRNGSGAVQFFNKKKGGA